MGDQVELEVPQANRLDRVIDRVRQLALGGGGDFAPRDAAYYQRAASILGWVDAGGDPTETGQAAARARDADERMAHALAAFERSELGRAWMRASGAASVEELRPETAREFIVTATDLGDSTADRRAGTLRNWLGDLRPLIDHPTDLLDSVRAYYDGKRPPPHAGRFFAEQLDVRLPTRLANWAQRKGITTFGELVPWEQSKLTQERNVGRTSIMKVEALIENATGLTWDRLRELMGGGVPPTPPASDSPLDWNALATACPDSLGERPIAELALPTRMINFCARKDIETLGGLLEWRVEDLREERNLGRRTINRSLALLRGLVGPVRPGDSPAAPETDAPPPPSLDDFPDLLGLLKSRMAHLRSVDRLVVTRRAGLHGPIPTLEDLGHTMGVSRERIRQLQTRATGRLSKEWWTSPLRNRLLALLPDGARPLEEIAQEDAFFSDLEEHTETLDFVLRRCLDGSARVVILEGEALVVTADPRDVRAALEDGLQAVGSLELPLPIERVLDVMRHHAARVAPGLTPFFERALIERLVTVDDDDGGALVTGVGHTVKNRVLAYLEEVKRPVSIDEVSEALGSRIRVPDEAIYTARGWIVLPRHVPDFELWSRRLVPLCIAVMYGADPSRQWSVVELLDEIAEQAQVPDWLGHWYLAGMLRLSGKVRYLGRLQVALDHDEAPEERLHTRALLVQLLRDAGAPLYCDELVSKALERLGASEVSLRMRLLQAPFVQIDRARFGLVDRDVPGGADALAEAEQALEDELEERQRGLSPGEAFALVHDLSDAHSRWSLELVRSVARQSESFRISRSDGIGLADWDDARLPTRRDIITSMVEEGAGRANIEAVQDRLEAEFGTRPRRWSLGNVASTLGIRVRGEELVRDDLLQASVRPPPIDVPDPASLPSFPAVARPLFQTLLQEPLGEFAELREQARAYVGEFEHRKKDLPHIDPEEARAAADSCARLVDRLAPDSDELTRRLVWAALRYFVEEEDGESDFAVGGLDDDIAVIDSVAEHLGWLDCRVERPEAPPEPTHPKPSIPDQTDALGLSIDARAHFDELKANLPAADLAALRASVQEHLERFQAAARGFELLPVDLAEELAEKLDVLLGSADSLSVAHRALLVGAARYFISEDDAIPDLSGVLGLDDDVEVFNHAIHQMGRDDLSIEQ